MAEPSVSGELWSNLYYLYFAIAAIVGALVVGWLFYNMWTFRYRPDRVRPADAPIAGTVPVERGHPLWSYVMAGLIALIMFGLAFGTISAVQTMEVPPEEGARVYHDIIGYQFGWKYNYTGAGGVPFQIITPGTTKFTIPVDTIVVFNVTSQDVWHNFAIPDFRIRIDAVPGKINPLWMQATEVGEYRNVCVQICGVNHARMHTMMEVLPKAEYDAWLQARSEEAFDRLETAAYRNAARGTVVNATFTGASLDLASQQVVPGMPVVLRVANEATEPITVSLGTATATVPAGETARVYALAPSTGSMEVVAGDQRATLEVSG